ncbi:MAG: type VI secretion system ATPase TssH [Xylophilus ampelinus]
MSTSLKTLVAKLDDLCRVAAERAAAITMAQGHHEVDIEHLLLALLEAEGSDLRVLCRRFDVPVAALQRDIEREMREFRGGNARTPVFSARLPVLLEHAWLIASLETQGARIRSAHLLLALLAEPGLAQIAQRASPLFARFDAGRLRHALDEATAGSREAPVPGTRAGGEPEEGDAPHAGRGEGAGPDAHAAALDRFTTDLTAQARAGRIDPVIGRASEIRQAVDILMRRRQNNPILTGEAGVGKTAVVEGLALRIVAGDVPAPLQDVVLRTLDLGLLQAGASVKGEFESRLQAVIDAVKQSPRPVVLFVDEAHTMIGAGGQAGQNDAANLLKPALARGELRTIAATTWSEYKRYFEKDAALARRFQVVRVDEPSESLAAAMLRGMVAPMERHFGVRIRDEAVTEAVRLSARYIAGRQLPDKAVGVLDTACARVALGQAAPPAAVEDLRQRLAGLDAEARSLERETGAGHEARLQALADERAALQARLEGLAARHDAERALVDELRAARDGGGAGRADDAALSAKRAELARLQGDDALVPLEVDAGAVAAIVASWTGIPLGKMVKDDLAAVLDLESRLAARVVGQPQAAAAIAQRVRTSRAALDDPGKPQGVFLFVGPSGVGKTESALALADLLYGGERKLVTINMSEFQEAHSVSGLKGSPPGYVGYGEGGVLTEAVRRAPYSVVLLDEAEKAHPDVLEMFYQVFDKGVLDDAEGRTVDFRHCVIILTSNVGSALTMQACIDRGPAGYPGADALAEALRPALYEAFKPALLGRMTVVPFYPIADAVLERIIRMKLDRIGARIAANHGAAFDYDARLVDAVLARCTEVDTGARNVDHILDGTLLPGIAGQVLERMADGRPVRRIEVGVSPDGSFRYAVA